MCHYESFSVPLLGLYSTDVTLVKAAAVLNVKFGCEIERKMSEMKIFSSAPTYQAMEEVETEKDGAGWWNILSRFV